MRRLCWFAGSFSFAVFITVYLFPDGALFFPGVLCLLAALLHFFLRRKGRTRLLLATLGLAAGFLWTGCFNLVFRVPAHSLANQSPKTYVMEVKEFPRETIYGSSLIVKLKLNHAPDPEVCLYAGPEALELQPGDTISASVKLSRSDFRRGESYDYYQSMGIYLTGNVQGELCLLTCPAHMPIQYWPQLAAKTIKDTIRLLFPCDLSGFFAALLMGDKSFLPDGLYAALRRSGVAHIVAVSGLHISFLSGLFSTLFRRKNRFTSALHILVLFFFAAMTGNSYSSLRAAFMASAVLLAPLAGREDDRLTTLSAALFILLIICPYSAASIGLQLSFTALLGVILITEGLNGRFQAAIPEWPHPFGTIFRKILLFLSGTLSVSLGATLFTLPLVAFHYRSVSLAAPLTNLLTLWAVSLAFVLGLLGLLGALAGTILPFAGWSLAWLAAWPARWVIWVVRGISHCPFAALSLLSGYLVLWFVVAYGIFALWLLSGGKVRFWVPGIALTLTLCAALLVQAYPTYISRLTVTFLDVGQGSSTLLYSKGHAVLVDCGGNKDNAGDIAADQIQALGLSNLDALVLTHYDSDHSNGVSELMERLTVSRVILPNVDINSVSRQNLLALCDAHNCDVNMLYEEDFSMTMGDTELNIYIPMGSTTSNTAGLSVLCSAGDFDLLITGDMDAATERRLIKYKALPDIELLLIGHHGSKNATSWELLESTRPEMAVISVGYNLYGHPTDQTMARLAAAGCEIYRTDWMGNVTFHISDP